MKTYLKIITLLSIVGILYISCTDDTNNFEVKLDTDTTDLIGVITTDATTFATGSTINFTVELPQTFTNDAKVTVVASKFETVDEFTTTIIIPAGETIGNGLLSPSLENVGFLGTNLKVKIKGLKLFSDDEDVTIEDNYTLTSNEIDINIGGSTIIKFSWDDSSDLDIILRDSSGAIVDDAQTGANPEVLSFSDTLSDGDYTLGVVYYSVEDDALNYTFDITNILGHEVIEGDLSGYTASTSSEIPVFTITKSGNSISVTEL